MLGEIVAHASFGFIGDSPVFTLFKARGCTVEPGITGFFEITLDNAISQEDYASTVNAFGGGPLGYNIGHTDDDVKTLKVFATNTGTPTNGFTNCEVVFYRVYGAGVGGA